MTFDTHDDAGASLRIVFADSSHLCVDLSPEAVLGIARAIRGEGTILRAEDSRINTVSAAIKAAAPRVAY